MRTLTNTNAHAPVISTHALAHTKTHTHKHTHKHIHSHTSQLRVAHTARGVTVRAQNSEAVAPSVLSRESIICAALVAGEAKDIIAPAPELNTQGTMRRRKEPRQQRVEASKMTKSGARNALKI